MYHSRKWLYHSLSLLLIVAFMAVALVPFAAPTSSVLAQEDVCHAGLTAEDCALLAASDSAMEALQSFNVQSLSLNLNTGTADGTVAIAVQGAGPVELNGDNPSVDLSFDPISVSADGETEETAAAFRLIDGTIYAAAEEEGALSWIGLSAGELDLEALTESLGEMGGLDGAGELPELPSGDVDLEAFSTWSRGENLTVDGQEVAVFFVDISLSQILTSPEVTEALTNLALELAAESDLGPSAVSIIVSTLLSQLSDQLASSTFRFTRHISIADNLTTFVGLDIAFTLDFGFARGFSRDIDSSLPDSPLDFSFSAAASFDQFNADFDIVPPDSYEDITADLQELFEEGLSGDLGFGPDFGGDVPPPAGSIISLESVEFDIAVGGEASGTLTEANAIDVYRVEAVAGSNLQIAVRAADPNSFLDPTVDLYDADGRLLESNDDAFDAPAGLELGALDSYLTYNVTADGSYLIVVGSVFSVDGENYTLIVTAE